MKPASASVERRPNVSAIEPSDDLRARMFALADAGKPFALATIVTAEGGPRAAGAQLVVTHDATMGFLSDGCVDADVALHGREVLASGEPKLLVYGKGSPWLDMRLPCGSRMEVLVERITPDDDALTRLKVLTAERRPAWWHSDGKYRTVDSAHDFGGNAYRVDKRYDPVPRLHVIGSDGFALEIARLGCAIGWEIIRRDRLDLAIVDAWTSVAFATHHVDAAAHDITAALQSAAAYVGVLGSKRRLPELLDALSGQVAPELLDKLRAPIGLAIGARSPTEIAVAVIAEMLAVARHADAARPGRLHHPVAA